MSPAPRNRSLTLSEADRVALRPQLLQLSAPAEAADLIDRVIHQDLFEVVPLLPEGFVDLLFIDPPYNLTKSFHGRAFKRRSTQAYLEWLESWLPALKRTLKPHASIYLCGDWRSGAAIHLAAEKLFHVQNRVTFEREKGRGARRDWKNAHEDIWFLTNSRDYFFNAEAVKLKRRVLAPYRVAGQPKDWAEEEDGPTRLTHASNFWTDLTIPFWSMPENTPHPTQKPEKLMAKILLASSRPGDVVLDPFAGVGTAGVAAKKLSRRFVMIEAALDYCLYAVKRLELAERRPEIQGYDHGVFLERNSGQTKRGREGR